MRNAILITTMLIVAHATCATGALIAGSFAITRERYLTPYFAALPTSVTCLLILLGVRWTFLDDPTRWLFATLNVLAVYTLWRSGQARYTRRPVTSQQSDRHLDHLGFTLIALVVGFVAISLLNLGAPGWMVALAGAVCIVIGHLGLQRIKARARVGFGVQNQADRRADDVHA